MRQALKEILRQPGSQEALEVAAFQVSPSGDGSVDVREGLLFAARRAYPIHNGVPVMIEGAVTAAFLDRHREAMAGDPRLTSVRWDLPRGSGWSFSRQWETHFAAGTDRTWGYTVEERFEQLLLEAQIDEAWLDGKLVLDAGCGNGALSEEVARRGAVVIGLDYSTGVMGAEQRRRSARVHFLQADLEAPPLAQGTFDLVVSDGVLHHTQDPASSFRMIAPLVKAGGKFYVWLYRRPEGFLGRYMKVPAYDAGRAVLSRLTPGVQRAVVSGYARLVRWSHALRPGAEPVPLREYVVSAYDDLTPRWRHYHTPFEVSRWFHASGFSPPVMTHWDNRYGFGMVATRTPQVATPGLHYGAGPRLWDERHTWLGRLHSED